MSELDELFEELVDTEVENESVNVSAIVDKDVLGILKDDMNLHDMTYLGAANREDGVVLIFVDDEFKEVNIHLKMLN